MKRGAPMIEPVPDKPRERPIGPAPLPPPRALQELWLALARRGWRSVVLVPADGLGSTAAHAAALAEVGRRLKLVPVAQVVAEALDYGAAADLARRVAVQAVPHTGAGPFAPDQLVVAIPDVLLQPLGVAVAREADAVVVCIELGRSSLAGAQRTIELIGRDRIAGCLVT
jgi:hypothetical protein